MPSPSTAPAPVMDTESVPDADAADAVIATMATVTPAKRASRRKICLLKAPTCGLLVIKRTGSESAGNRTCLGTPLPNPWSA